MVKYFENFTVESDILNTVSNVVSSFDNKPENDNDNNDNNDNNSNSNFVNSLFHPDNIVKNAIVKAISPDIIKKLRDPINDEVEIILSKVEKSAPKIIENSKKPIIELSDELLSKLKNSSVEIIDSSTSNIDSKIIKPTIKELEMSLNKVVDNGLDKFNKSIKNILNTTWIKLLIFLLIILTTIFIIVTIVDLIEKL